MKLRTTIEDRIRLRREYKGHLPVIEALNDLQDALAEIARLEALVAIQKEILEMHREAALFADKP